MPPTSGQVYAFSVFTYDPETGVLLRNGKRLRIPEQCSRLLAVLLENSGSLVTRKQLRDILWPEGSFLDHDHAINKAISLLRAILRDNPKSPSAIETIPKRGYRFVAELKSRPEPQLPAASHPLFSLHTISTVPSPSRNIPTGPIGEVLVNEPEEKIARLEFLLSDLFEEKTSPSSRRRWIWIAASVAAVLALITGGVFFLHHQTTQPGTPQAITVGIAPFDVTGAGAEQVAESFRMELTDSVSRMPSVQVRAAHSFRTNKQDSDSIRALARTLDLDNLIFGKFTLEGDRCWLQLELVRGSDATHLATLQYSGGLNELAEMRKLAQHDLFLRLQVQETPNLVSHGNTVNAEAYRHYLKARYLTSQRTDDSLHEAIDEFENAINNDPSYAKAYAGMAGAHVALAEHGTAPFDENYRAAQSLTQTALSLDPLLAEAQALDGYIAFRYKWDLATAQNKLRKAIELEPGSASYHIWYSIVLTTSGQFDEAFQQLDFAETADPFWPAVYVTDSFAANAARNHKRSIDAAQKLVQLMPDWPLAFDTSGWSYWNAGQYAEAIQTWRQMAVLEKDDYRQKLEERGLQAFRHGGATAYAKVRLQAIAENAAKTRNQNDFVPEEWYAYANDKQHAIDALRTTVNRHSPDALNIALNPAFDILHNDPMYLELVKKVGVPMPKFYSTSM